MASKQEGGINLEINPLLQVQNLRVSYESGKKEILKDVSFNLEAGEIPALLGLNGSGKTTLLKAVCGLLPSTADKWELCSRSARKMTGREISSLVSYIPQKHSIMYHIATVDVVLMGVNPRLRWYQTPTVRDRSLAVAMLEYIGLGNKAQEDFLSLSEGQKQMAILARAMVQNAPVMLFDEPDSGLDYENKRLIFEQIRLINREKGYSALLALHDPDYALRYCDRIILLKNGGIEGTINCRKDGIQEILPKLRTLYPRLDMIKYKHSFLTLK